MKHKIEIIELLSRIVIIEANSREEAEIIIQDMYRKEEIILTSDDYDYTKINYVGEIK